MPHSVYSLTNLNAFQLSSLFYCLYLFLHIFTSVYLCVCACLCVCLSICVHAYVRVCVCVLWSYPPNYLLTPFFFLLVPSFLQFPITFPCHLQCILEQIIRFSCISMNGDLFTGAWKIYQCLSNMTCPLSERLTAYSSQEGMEPQQLLPHPHGVLLDSVLCR